MGHLIQLPAAAGRDLIDRVRIHGDDASKAKNACYGHLRSLLVEYRNLEHEFDEYLHAKDIYNLFKKYIKHKTEDRYYHPAVTERDGFIIINTELIPAEE